MGECGQERGLMLCVLKSGDWSQAQHGVRSVWVGISLTKATCGFSLVGNCIFILSDWVSLPLSTISSIGCSHGHGINFTSILVVWEKER